MKKFVSLLLCVALLCSMVVVVAHADGTPTAKFADVTTVPGGTVTVNMGLENNPGLVGLRFTISDDDSLGATFEGTNASSILNLTSNNDNGTYLWDGIATNENAEVFGTLAITIPSEAEAGTYTFTVVADQGAHCVAPGNNQKVTLAGTSFTVTVTDKVIDGVNVAIDAGTAIGVHVQTSDPDNTSITVVSGDKFITIEDYVEGGENGGYFYYLNVNPWDMDKEFTVDFTGNFEIDEKTDELNLGAIPATAKTVSILGYCEKVKGTSVELDQLIADLLAFGQQAQIYNGAAEASYALPEGLTATEAAWEDGEGNPTDFGTYCSENFPEALTGKNATAKKKFEFDYATIEFGSKFVATFTFKNGATATASNLARVKVNGETYSLDGWNFVYSFNPAEYGGVEFDLYAAASTTSTNFAWINNYGPAHFAAYLNDTYGEDAADILAILEAFYLYGTSVEAYAATLG